MARHAKPVIDGETLDVREITGPWRLRRIRSGNKELWQVLNTDDNNTWTYNDSEGGFDRAKRVFDEKVSEMTVNPATFKAAGRATLALLTGEQGCVHPRCYDCAPDELKAAIDAVWVLYESTQD